MTRRTGILFGLLIAQLLLVVFTFWPRSTGRAAGSLFDGLALNPDIVKGLTVQNALGSYTLMRDIEGAWSMGDAQAARPVDQAAVNALVGRLGSVTMARLLGKTADPAHGLDDPLATVTITAQPEGGVMQTTTLTIGAADEAAGTYAVKSSTSDFTVAVPQFQLQDFVTKGRTQLEPVQSPAPPSPLTGTQMITATGVITP